MLAHKKKTTAVNKQPKLVTAGKKTAPRKSTRRTRADTGTLPSPPLTPKVIYKAPVYRRPPTHFPEGEVGGPAAVLHVIIHRCFMSLADPMVPRHVLQFAKKLTVGYDPAEYVGRQPPVLPSALREFRGD